jgi:hypothetical protein
MNHTQISPQRLSWVVLLAAVLIGGPCTAALAQIYQWTDESGVRHFANSLDRVPEEARDRAEVVVNSPPSAAGGSEQTATAPGSPEENDQAEEQDPYVSGWESGFDAGWYAAMRARDEEQPVCPAEPQVVVLESRPPVVLNAPYDPTGAYCRSPYTGTITVPFDYGASRGFTARQRMQDLRTLERGW